MNFTNTNRAPRGITIVEVLAILVCVAVLVAMGLPAFSRVGCHAMRDVSRANLATLSQAHVAYANDWDGRQYTIVPDTLGVSGGQFGAWETANGCVPQALLGTTTLGVHYTAGTECAGGSIILKQGWLKPLDFSRPSANGAFRLANARLVNQYVGGRFYDPKFYAPDDPLLNAELRAVMKGGGDFEELSEGLVPSTYTYSPAAMFDPRVLGFGGSLTNPPYQFPDSNLALGGQGYRSPTVSQCVHPSLKTRLMEMWAIENPPYPCSPVQQDSCLPCQWNGSFRSRPLTLFFDGSVRIMTPREPMFAEDRANASLWVRSTPFGGIGVNGQWSGDFIVDTSVHFLTASGIAGRDTISY